MRRALAIWILALAQHAPAAAADSDSRSVIQGRAFFNGFQCKRCHRVGEEGGKLAPDLSFVGFRKTPEWLDRWLKDPRKWKHNTIMPKFYFPDSVRRDIVAYLSTLKGEAFEIKDFPPWNRRALMVDPVKRGEVIFQRAGCIGCHGRRGKGGYPNNNVYGERIPALTFVSDGYTKEELKARIRKGVKPMKKNPAGPDPLIFMPPWGEVLQENEISAVVEYLLSLRPPLQPGDEW